MALNFQTNFSSYTLYGILPQDLIHALSKELNYPIEFFYRPCNFYPLRFFYRKDFKNPTTLRNIEAIVNITTDNISHLLNSVEIDVNLPYTDLDQMQLTPSDFARQARFFFGLPKGPICDIIHLMESNGIILRPLDCTVEASFSALSTLTK